MKFEQFLLLSVQAELRQGVVPALPSAKRSVGSAPSSGGAGGATAAGASAAGDEEVGDEEDELDAISEVGPTHARHHTHRSAHSIAGQRGTCTGTEAEGGF